jgi:WD40 repeat protein
VVTLVAAMPVFATEMKAADVRELAQGQWAREYEHNGQKLRMLKHIDGNKETISIYLAKELVNQWTVDCEIRTTENVTIYTYSNMTFTAGRDKGKTLDHRGSYLLQIKGDRLFEVSGVMNWDKRNPKIVTYERVRAPTSNGLKISPGGPAKPTPDRKIEGFRLVRTMRTEGAAYMAEATCDGGHILATGSGGTLWTWDARTGRELSQIEAHKDGAVGLSLSPDGKQAVTGGNDTIVRLWDLEAERELRRFEGHDDKVWSVKFSPDGRQILSGSHDKTMRLWDVATGREVRRFEGLNAAVWATALSPDGRLAASASLTEGVRLWDLGTRQKPRALQGLAAAMTVAFSPCGTQVLGGGVDKPDEGGEKPTLMKNGLLVVWDIETGNQRARFQGHTAAVRAVAISPDGRRAVTSGYDHTVRLWDLEGKTELASYDWPEPALLFGVAFTPDGRRVVATGGDGTVRVLEITVDGRPRS